MLTKVLVLVIFGSIGLAFLAAYLRDVVHVVRLWLRGVRTTGEVVDIEEERSLQTMQPDSRVTWIPVVAFHDRQGRRRVARPVVRTSSAVRRGQRLPVVYKADDPEVMLLCTPGRMVAALLGNSICLIVGALFTASAVAVFLL